MSEGWFFGKTLYKLNVYLNIKWWYFINEWDVDCVVRRVCIFLICEFKF